jgi:hypothetical protein
MRLEVVKSLVNFINPAPPHGMFLPWIEAEFEMSADTANNMMRVSEVYGDKYRTVRDLQATALYELAKPSTPQPIREQVEALLVDGQKMTVADIRRFASCTYCVCI